jgi:hypothetical protein
MKNQRKSASEKIVSRRFAQIKKTQISADFLFEKKVFTSI